FELMIALIISGYSASRGLTKVYLPFTGEIIDLGAWYFPICVFVFLAVTNSVNLTDGLDGLAAGTGYIYAACMAIVILLQVENFPTRYANGAEYKNLSLLLCALSGGLIGFLLFNTYKASVFMGDTGSLALGGFIASASLISGNLIFIPVIGITYVASSISVILQVAHFKRTGKRIFLMSPLHHHFQHKGYAESKIVFAYKFITFFVGLICIISCIRR
ncbi:MAG: phospho-N-acetylmuramoyl-pentapeptide-transferase, partial [Clostridia bacterium]|nr:phospho-N-acetylmuramoyl-pentapeptide-transferase [Clostridia bacterium]